ncbi:hypothetical protein MRB53_003980 [Persea americana]|uniref:Uncharacterized protein n=1 Tax=Persea americana TaxID=3435 RepID=A0ACC2N2J0_PERAE|nr:hypothetical protein MRB53_003980 [Persea americana]
MSPRMPIDPDVSTIRLPENLKLGFYWEYSAVGALIEAVSASESDEEPLKDEDDDSSIATNEFEDELGGSVAESSRSDEKYDEVDPMEDGKSGGNDVATRKEDLDLYTNHSGCCHGQGKACKRCRRALSMRHSRKLSQGSLSFRRVHSLPLQRNLSHKNKTSVGPT